RPLERTAHRCDRTPAVGALETRKRRLRGQARVPARACGELGAAQLELGDESVCSTRRAPQRGQIEERGCVDLFASRISLVSGTFLRIDEPVSSPSNGEEPCARFQDGRRRLWNELGRLCPTIERAPRG